MGTVQSWGRYPYEPQQAHAVAWRDALDTAWLAAKGEHGTTLAFGNGRSYGDSCLAASGHVMQTRPLDRLIAADWNAGILRAEPGVTLEQLLEVAIPRGWMLPVTPGTKYATLGGAIANDVHGKNHHVRGTFGRHVRRFGLARSDGSQLECARDSHAELFAATIGGLGLTGLITWAEIQLMPIRSSLVDVTSIRFGNLDEFFALSERLDPLHEYSVAWVDCQSTGAALGRGVFMVGDHASDGPLTVDRRPKHTVPFTLPIPLFNRVTLRGNALYFRGRRGGEVRSRASYDSYFYPLDSLLEWNRIYGRAGFQQHQSVIPRKRRGTRYGQFSTPSRQAAPAHSWPCSSAAATWRHLVCCRSRWKGRRSPLTFHSARHQTRACSRGSTRSCGKRGRLYPAKDAHMSGADFRAAYPQWQQLEALRDPAMLSRFWERTTRT